MCIPWGYYTYYLMVIKPSANYKYLNGQTTSLPEPSGEWADTDSGGCAGGLVDLLRWEPCMSTPPKVEVPGRSKRAAADAPAMSIVPYRMQSQIP